MNHDFFVSVVKPVEFLRFQTLTTLGTFKEVRTELETKMIQTRLVCNDWRPVPGCLNGDPRIVKINRDQPA